MSFIDLYGGLIANFLNKDLILLPCWNYK